MASERVTSRYQRLFELRVLHHYWLDEGAVMFDSLSTTNQNDRLLRYDVRRFLAIEPTPTTRELLAGIHAVSRATSQGIVAAVPEGMDVPGDAELEYAITVVDPQFFSYTARTLPPQTLHTLQHTPTLTSIQFKENVAVFSNTTGVSRGAGPSKTLFLSREFPAITGTDTAEALVNIAGALFQLDGDQPGATTHQIAASAADSPVFANQADIPAIVPPAGVVGTVPARGIQLTDEIPSNVFALVRIAIVTGGDPDFDCTALGAPKDPAPIFQIRLKNRSTIWRYFDRANPGAATSEAGPFPLTHFGNATTTQKPAVGRVSADMNASAISRLVSEIFV